MIVGTCIRSIFNSIKLDKREVLDDLSMLNFAILSKNVIHNVFVDVVDATDEKLSDKNQLMDFGWWSRLVGQLLLFSLGQLHVGLLQLFVEV